MCGGGGGWRGSGGSGGSSSSGDSDDDHNHPPISPQDTGEEESQEETESGSEETDDTSGTGGVGTPTGGDGNRSGEDDNNEPAGDENTDQDDEEVNEPEGDEETESDDQSEETDDEDCFIDEDTLLESTNPGPLNDAVLGDVFPIEIREGRPCVVNEENRILGSILGDLGEQLLQCRTAGYRYRAEILEIEGRKCEVRVTNKCLINSTALLASPDPDRLNEVSEGQVLDVVVRDESLCVVSEADRIVGPIAKPWTETLIECVESAEIDYIAEVTDIDGGACEVRVKNKPPEE